MVDFSNAKRRLPSREQVPFSVGHPLPRCRRLRCYVQRSGALASRPRRAGTHAIELVALWRGAAHGVWELATRALGEPDDRLQPGGFTLERNAPHLQLVFFHLTQGVTEAIEASTRRRGCDGEPSALYITSAGGTRLWVFFTASFTTPSLETQGFIHASGTLAQAIRVANRKSRRRLASHTRGRSSPHRVARPRRVGERRRALPHIYGPLNTDAIVEVVHLKRDSSGKFVEP